MNFPNALKEITRVLKHGRGRETERVMKWEKELTNPFLLALMEEGEA